MLERQGARIHSRPVMYKHVFHCPILPLIAWGEALRRAKTAKNLNPREFLYFRVLNYAESEVKSILASQQGGTSCCVLCACCFQRKASGFFTRRMKPPCCVPCSMHARLDYFHQPSGLLCQEPDTTMLLAFAGRCSSVFAISSRANGREFPTRVAAFPQLTERAVNVRFSALGAAFAALLSYISTCLTYCEGYVSSTITYQKTSIIVRWLLN
jgi:hypothetical protein